MLVIALLACGEPAPDKDTQPAPTDTVEEQTTAWIGAPPLLVPQELVRGETSLVAVRQIPPGSVATLYRSVVGEGAGPCEDGLCLGLLEPEPLGELVADELGEASIEIAVAEDEPASVWMFQASVLDPATGRRTLTTVELRQVSVPLDLARVKFVLANTAAGLDATHTTGNSHTGGIAWTDLDGDWWPDLVITNGSGANRIMYLNNGDGTFRNASDRIRKVNIGMEDAGVVAGDIDRDGDVDLIIAGDNPTPVDIFIGQPYEGGPNELWRNDGRGHFVEDAGPSGVLDPRGWRTSSLGLADWDRDGLLDLYLGTWAMSQLPAGDNPGRLLHNTGDGRFEDVPGPDAYGRDTLEVLWFDADLDLNPDLYVGNVSHLDEPPDYEPRDVLYRGTADGFADVTDGSPGFGDDAWAAMGADAADIENDGDLDLYVTTLFALPSPLPRGNPLYVNQGDGTFADNSCDVAGICSGHETWPAVFADFDRDRWSDLYVGTSMRDDPDLLYINDGDGTFTSHRVEAFGSDISRGGSQADYDGDGDVDLFVWMWGRDSRLYRNTGRDVGHWLELKLVGQQSNPDAIGAWLEIRSGGVSQLRWVSGGDSAHSQRDTLVHVGLGPDNSAEVTVHWPSGIVQELRLDDVDRLVAIDELAGEIPEEVAATATWDPTTLLLTVEATSTYRGRSQLTLDGFGPVRWDAERAVYSAEFPAASLPGPLALRSRSADPVAVVPTSL